MIFENLFKIFNRTVHYKKQINSHSSSPNELNNILKKYADLEYLEYKICGITTGVNYAKMIIYIPFMDKSYNIVIKYIDIYVGGKLSKSYQFYNDIPQTNEYAGLLSMLFNKSNNKLNYKL